MNFEKKAKKLEEFLKEELEKNPLITVLEPGCLIYNKFIIKHNKNYKWSIKRFGGFVLDNFHLKTCALIATKLHSNSNFKNYNDLKILDESYFKNSTDCKIYKYRYKQVKDNELKSLFLSRYTESKIKSDYAKKQILYKFNSLF